jgi:hypothetical protein
MRRAIIVVFLAALGALYLYSAFAPNRTRRPLPFKIGSLRRALHAFLGAVLLLGVLLLIYAFLSTIAED